MVSERGCCLAGYRGACLAAVLLAVVFAGTVAAGSEAASLSVPGELLPELVLIPAGEMAVGDPDRRSAGTEDAEPRRVVFERPFLMGKFEITFEQWDQCHRAGGCDHNPDDKGWGRADRPVIDVSWDHVEDCPLKFPGALLSPMEYYSSMG